MKHWKTIYHAIFMVVGLTLVVLAFLGMLNDFWNGMGSALVIVGAVRLLRDYRVNKNEAYREKVEVAATDERNQFIRGKAWSWAGYLFIIIAGLSVIGFEVAGNGLLSRMASWAVCLMLILYWGAYLVLEKKY